MSVVHYKPDQESTTDDLRLQLASSQRTRTLGMWHDHSTVLQQGYILFAVWIVYDPAELFMLENYLYCCSCIRLPSVYLSRD